MHVYVCMCDGVHMCVCVCACLCERERERQREREREREREKEREDRDIFFLSWLLNVTATCQCISGTDLLRQFYVLPH